MTIESRPRNRRVLVVDDSEAIHQDFRKILTPGASAAQLDAMAASIFGGGIPRASQLPPFELVFAHQGEEACEKVRDACRNGNPFAVAFVDIRMPPGKNGIDTLCQVFEDDPELQAVICSAYADFTWDEVLDRTGHPDRLLIVKKPFEPIEVLQMAYALTEKWNLARDAANTLDALRQSDERYALAARGSNDGLWDWDLVTNRIFLSERWMGMAGCENEACDVAPEEWYSRVHSADLPRLTAAIQEHLEGKKEYVKCEYRLRHADGTYRWMAARGVAVFGSGGKPLRLAGSQSDIANAKLAEMQWQHDAYHDPLTGLANRALMLDRLTQAVKRGKRIKDYRFVLLFIDLDHFKEVNDRFGHHAGDQLLIATARRLEGCLRPGDTVARMGGDEFAVLLDDVQSVEDSKAIAERIQSDVCAPLRIEDQEVSVTASIGLTVGTPEVDRPESLIYDADSAMYRAKTTGKNRKEIGASGKTPSLLKWESDLRRALERNEFVLQYQPILSLGTGRIAGFEALLRWQHPERGMMQPYDFIFLAEEAGILSPLSHWVLATACRQMKEWRKLNPTREKFWVSVNLSGRLHLEPGLAQAVEGLVKTSGIEIENLKLEFSEKDLGGSTEKDRDEENALNSLGARNIRLLIDDFGTGGTPSPISGLHRMPIDALKIDRSFIRNMTGSERNLEIVRSIIGVARKAGMETMAEGIENAEQLKLLKELCCDYGQGFLFSRPVDAGPAGELLAKAQVWTV